ncbi:molybdopterin-dependent oxidoreductase [Ideonella sp.]|jgi:anaerobic selenocysteine-containing dehydrogenase|uniref:molybdopterin-dependent oxidoreductase n=1 Tax=Ideonella sp. TaxID=1929293 RepID=UPI0037BEA028
MDSSTADTPITLHHRICPLCEACCGLTLKVQSGRVISIRGHEEDVFSAGYICPKGVALKDLHEDPDRLRTPLIKRDGRHVESTWDEAWAEIARRLPAVQAAHGRDAVGLVAGNPSSHKIGLMLYLGRLIKALGSRQIFTAATLDQMPRHLSSGLLFGQWMSVPVPDIERCDFLLVLGANPVVSNGSMWTVPDFKGKARALQARGGQLVVIDPRRTETAALADAHHFIRPGGDVFLLLGMVHTLFAEELVRLGRLADWTQGLEQVREAVQPFAPELVAQRCGLAADTIRHLARTLAQTPRASVYARIGTCTQHYGALNTWLVDLLNLLTGHLDEPGGAMFPKAAAFAVNTGHLPAAQPGQGGKGRGVALGRFSSRVSAAPEVMGELPIGCLAEEMETPGTGQIKALITVATNPVLSAPNGPRLSAAFAELDFMVSMDIYLNETSRHADVILPAPSPLEDLHYDVPYPQLSWRNHARYSPPVFAPAAGQPMEWETLLRLAAIASGQTTAPVDAGEMDDQLFSQDMQRRFGELAPAVLAATAGLRGPDRLLELALRTGPYGDLFGQRPGGLTLASVKARSAAGGIDLGPLQPRIPELLMTPSGKIEMAPPPMLADLPRALADLQQPTPDLVIIGRRDARSNNSWMHNLPTLAKGPFRCTALVHPADAGRLGLADGAPVRISSHTAQGPQHIEAQVSLCSDMMPGVVSLPHGWGHDLPGTQLQLAAQRPGANLNALLDETQRDPLSGTAVLSGLPIEMVAVSAA